MEKDDKEICGFFTVENESHEIKRVIVSQPYVSYYEKTKTYVKRFNLESLDGPPVYKTNRAEIFQLTGGDLLKRKKDSRFWSHRGSSKVWL